MTKKFALNIKTISFDENYTPSDDTRLTTNFANLARGESCQQNLRNTIRMINNRFNSLADWDNPKGDRYSVELDIVSVDIDVEGDGKDFPIIEVLNTNIIDHKNDQRLSGIVGNSFSSYVRDYDFSVLLAEHNKDKSEFSLPEGYGDLHGKLFKYVVNSDAFRASFNKSAVICLSVSSSRTYYRTGNEHPILGIEYQQDEYSLTDQYFDKMGLKVRYFMPKGSKAPFAFYHCGDLLSDYSNLELISTISTMETFQKIYRPEIYNANSPAGKCYEPRLNNEDHSLTQIDYDRVERSQLAVEQGKYTEEDFIKPYKTVLEQWASNYEN